MKALRSSLWFALLGGTTWFFLCVLATCLDTQSGFSALLLNGVITVDLLLALSERISEQQLQLYLGSEIVVVGILLASWLGAIVWAWLVFWVWRWVLQRYWQKVAGFLQQACYKLSARLN